LLVYVSASYEPPSSLAFGHFKLSSEEGVQQEDSLGPFLFSMALDGVLRLPNCDLVEAYLDDVVLGGKAESLGAEFAKFRDGTINIGLRLNESKCKVMAF